MSLQNIKPSLPFVGREPELRQLHQTLQTVVDLKKPTVVLVKGDYGVGKTALVEYFLKEVTSLNPKILIGRGLCSMESESSGLVPFAQLFINLTSLGKNRSVASANFVKFAKEVAPAWLDIVTAGVASATLKTVEETGKLIRGNNAFSKENVFVQFTNAISRLAEKQPVVAFIDDLQWADASSLGLLFHLVRNIQNRAILFIITYRPVEAMESGINASLFRDIRGNLIRYGSVEIEIEHGIDVLEYVAKRYPLNEFPTDLIKHVHDITDGHALFVNQIFSLWEDTHTIIAIPSSNGLSKWILSKNADIDFTVPQTLGEVLAERIHSMSEELRQILVYASVEGEDFSVQTIARLRQLNELIAIDDLELLDHHYYLVFENGTKTIGSEIFDFYRFTHRFFREHIHDQLSTGQKRILHKQVAECLEALYTDRREIAGQLATHFRIALDLMKSAQYSLMAAQFEQSRYAWEEGENWCQSGIDLLSKLPPDTKIVELRISLLEQSCYGHYAVGNYTQAEENYRDAMILAQQSGDLLKLAELCNQLVYICGNEGLYEESLRLIDQAKKILTDGAIPFGELQLELEANWAFMQSRLGKQELAIEELLKSLADAQSLPQTASIELIKREIYIGLGVVYNDLNQYKQSIAAYEEGINIDERFGREFKLAIDYSNISGTYLRMNELDQSMSNCVKGESLAKRVGDLDGQSYAKICIGDTWFEKGNPREAIKEFSEAIVIMEQIGVTWFISHAYSTMALAYRVVSDLDAAFQKAKIGLEYAEKDQYQVELGYSIDALAQIEASRQEWTSAELHFSQAIANFQKSGSLHFAARSQYHQAEMLIAQGHHQEAINLMNKAMEVFKEFGLSHEVIKTQFLLETASKK